MTLLEIQQSVDIIATVTAVSGGLIGLIKYFSDKRDKELREWQKVVIYKIFRQNEMNPLSFSTIRERYLNEAQAFMDIDLKKKEISEDTLRRVLLELTSTNIIYIKEKDSFQLNIIIQNAVSREIDIFKRMNDALVKLVAQHPYLYTYEDILKNISEEVGVDANLLIAPLNQSIKLGYLVVNASGHIAFQSPHPPSHDPLNQ